MKSIYKRGRKKVERRLFFLYMTGCKRKRERRDGEKRKTKKERKRPREIRDREKYNKKNIQVVSVNVIC